ncbi:hypothetical protein Tco_0294333 [Tanacetum coccineum]
MTTLCPVSLSISARPGEAVLASEQIKQHLDYTNIAKEQTLAYPIGQASKVHGSSSKPALPFPKVHVNKQGVASVGYLIMLLRKPIPIVASSSHPKKTHKQRKTKRKATEISQSSRPTTLVVDETVHEERGDNVEMVATTTTSFDAEQGSGSRPPSQYPRLKTSLSNGIPTLTGLLGTPLQLPTPEPIP